MRRLVGEESNNHVTGESTIIRFVILSLDSRNTGNLPNIYSVLFRWFLFVMIEPICPEFPSGRQAQCIAALLYRNRILKKPVVLEHVGTAFLFEFKTDYGTYVGTGNCQDLFFGIVELLRAAQAAFQSVFFLGFVFLAFLRNAPTAKGVDLGFVIEV